MIIPRQRRVWFTLKDVLQLLASPGCSYLEAVLSAIARARRVTLVVAFASPAGVDELDSALDRLLANPLASAHIILGMDRQGFNGVAVIEKLLKLRARFGTRLDLGLVIERTGLMHAKGLLTEGPHGAELFVGSANLTRSALRENHELGLHVLDTPPELVRAFHSFARGLYPARLDEETAPDIIRALGGRRSSGPPLPSPPSDAWREISAVLASIRVTDLAEPPEEFIKSWIARGYFVKQGRRASEVLTIRLPLDALAERGLLKKIKRRSIDETTRESRTLGYVIDLLPTRERKELQRALRRVVALAPRLGLQLSCFGLWMPETYWPVFESARDELLRASALDQNSLREAAESHRTYLLDERGLEDALSRVVHRLTIEAGLLEKDRAEVRIELEEYARTQLEHRTPELVSQVVDFRTGRQRWAPFEASDMPYRQLIVDVVQSLFASTERTGRWPRSLRSYAGRALLSKAEERLISDDVDADARALEMRSFTHTWESGQLTLTEALKQFRCIVPDDFEFPVPDVAGLIESVGEEAEDDDGEDI